MGVKNINEKTGDKTMPGKDGTGPLGEVPMGNGNRGGRGKMRGPYAAGIGGNCVCPKCSSKIYHIAGQPCNSRTCPECGTMMVRE